ncbi:hypothetical protein [Microbaculum marinisediminis]|uniref:Uncharacterized protein n=1 Tax=Microbaculum marinisediminis TaxID=2931392 RepID=A0AAW5QXE0_9HYPH|nr:hypothetical protein [Microbaculum sp. A6E488]MCT8971333.1 hypothetical protein [Microbaculum sp. A6E488]
MADTQSDADKTAPQHTTVVTEGSSGAGWFLVGALIVALVGGLWLYTEGYFGGGDADIDVKIELPTVNKPAE